MSKLSKSILSIIVLILIIIGVAPGLIGLWAKNQQAQVIKNFNSLHPDIKLIQTHYQYGWFRSHANFTIQSKSDTATTLTIKSTIEQGPIVVYRANHRTHVSLALLVVHSQLNNAKYFSAPLPITVRVNFLGHQTVVANVANWSLLLPPDVQLKVKGLKLTLHATSPFNPDMNKVNKAIVTINQVSFKLPKPDPKSPNKVILDNIRYTMHSNKNQPSPADGSAHFQIQAITVNWPRNSDKNLKLTNLRLMSKMKRTSSNKINVKARFDLGDILYTEKPNSNNPLKKLMPIGPIAYHFSAVLDQKALQAFVNQLQALQQQSQQSQQSFNNKALQQSAINLLSKGLSFKINKFLIKAPKNSAKLHLQLTLPPFAPSLGFMAIPSHHNLTAQLMLSHGWAQLLTQYLLAQSKAFPSAEVDANSVKLLNKLVQMKVLTLDNGNYKTTISSNNGAVKINQTDARSLALYIATFLHSGQSQQHSSANGTTKQADNAVPATNATASTSPEAEHN